MRILITTLAIIAASLGLVLSILPFGAIALIPIVIAFILGFIAFKMAQKDGVNTKLVKVVFLITIIALVLSIYRTVIEDNVVENDIETIEKEKQSQEDALEELEDLDIEN
ncbi:FUSC family protein [Flavobacteriaceae bacterium S0825]|uniref:FUSC family protein n=1 Tax=Gaetbulibacter sp. S0825 TaxID=2720084 RepID=UPI00142FA29E|nr:FUSC family protein [Gaetbulibacter sp. S0825]MCK0109424.1 FUSC family protein [Flavobacteriaceae bacterium S0825]NIX65059.1 FUSC family protein [Gaetbulibacter sp. S0825]